MSRRWRLRAVLASAVLAAIVGALGALTAGPAAAGGTPGPLPTSDPAPPGYYEPISRVVVVASSPLWSLTRDPNGDAIPLSWHLAEPLPAGQSVTYEVQTRYWPGNSGKIPVDPVWSSWVVSTSATSLIFDPATANVYVESGDAWEFRVRALDPSGATGPWSVGTMSNIPLDDNWHNQVWQSGGSGGHWGPGWALSSSSGDYYGSEHTTTHAGLMYLGVTQRGTRVALFGTKCPTCGKVEIDFTRESDGRLFGATVDTYAKTTEHEQVLWQGVVPMSLYYLQTRQLATPGRPRVNIDAYGIGF